MLLSLFLSWGHLADPTTEAISDFTILVGAFGGCTHTRKDLITCCDAEDNHSF